jgi:hypothetical protein
MAYSPFLEAYKITSVAEQIPNIQAFSFGKGRNYVTDNYRSGTAVLEGRRPDLLPSLAVGDNVRIDIGVDGSSSIQVRYRVANLQVNYGTIPAMDTWTMDLEDAFAILGRADITTSWSAGTDSYTAFSTVCSAASVGISGSVSSKTVSAQSFTNANALEIAQNVIDTSQAYVVADATGLIWSNSDWPYSANSIAFSDAGAVGSIQYDSLVFGSLIDNYATKVVVSASGLADQSSGTGNLSYSFDTYASSTSDATAIAQFVAGNLAANTASPLQISCTIKEQSNTNLFLPLNAPYLATVTFRTVTYSCYILGFRFSGDPENIRATYYLASASFLSQFVLDSSTNGVLNTNKLGF